MPAPSLTALLAALRRVRDLERRLGEARDRRDVEIVNVVEAGMRPVELARRISGWVTESTVRQAVRRHRHR